MVTLLCVHGSGGRLNMSEKTDNLTAKQRRALDALLSGLTKAQAAAAAGVTVRTLARWRADDAFDDALRDATHAATRDAAVRLAGMMDKSLTVIGGMLDDDDTTASVRLRAALATIDAHLRLLEVTDVLERLEALESVVVQ